MKHFVLYYIDNVYDVVCIHNFIDIVSFNISVLSEREPLFGSHFTEGNVDAGFDLLRSRVLQNEYAFMGCISRCVKRSV